MASKHPDTCVVAGVEYLIHPQLLGSVQESIKPDQVVPVVVLDEWEISTPDRLQEKLRYLLEHDDVCIPEFTSILVVKPSESNPRPEAAIFETFSTVYHLKPDTLRTAAVCSHGNLQSGPYFLSGQGLHQAWRFYVDHLDAFTFGLVPEDPFDPKKFWAISSQASDGISKTIPVPSRMYYPHCMEGPVAGRRFAVQDTFDVKGVKTNLSSRSWSEFYPAPGISAELVKKFIGLGAVIVGKAKTSQFCSGLDWVDFRGPTNPRGDRYQEPSGGSAGVVAALAGYDWLDSGICRDSDGSIQETAARHGVFSQRCSVGAASLDGTRMDSPEYDSVCLLDRCLNELLNTEHQILGRATGASGFPTRILYPTDFFPLKSSIHQKLVEQFIEALEDFSGTKRVEINLAKLWCENPPPDGVNKTLQEYMTEAPFKSLCYDYYHAYSEFKEEYWEQFGREPFVERIPKYRWEIGAGVSDDDYSSYMKKVEVFRDWFGQNVMTTDEATVTTAMMVLPCGTAGPKYRDEPADPPTVSEGIDPKSLAQVLGTPVLTVPFAQAPYQSRISERPELLPVSVSLMGAKGSDVILTEVARDSVTAKEWMYWVLTGRHTFPLGHNQRNVQDEELPSSGRSTPSSEGDSIVLV